MSQKKSQTEGAMSLQGRTVYWRWIPLEERPQRLRKYSIYLEWEQAETGLMIYHAQLPALENVFALGGTEQDALQRLVQRFLDWKERQKERSRMAGFLLPLYE